MPNFHTHWLVALQSLERLPENFQYLLDGRDTYVARAQELRDDIRAEVDRIVGGRAEDGAARLAAAAGLHDFIAARTVKFEDSLREDASAIAFSAFMLGACGPDFWMLPAEVPWTVKPAFAEVHFDLGHYNRAHLQFERSVAALGKRHDPQARAERAYFLGMATHLAGDLVIHQLVNVYAGAYNLLKVGKSTPYGVWSNEQGHETNTNAGGAGAALGRTVADVLPVWTTHNKVEHYWDTWVRYRWLGDYGNVIWASGDVELAGFEPLGLPLCDTLRRELLEAQRGRARSPANGEERRPEHVSPADVPVGGMAERFGHGVADVARSAVRFGSLGYADKQAMIDARVDQALGVVETRWVLEKPLAFPWLFCDAVLRGTLEPFIYDRVVDKKGGAYPAELVFQKAVAEASSAQMASPAAPKPPNPGKGPKPGAAGSAPSEKKKLQFFSTERNQAIGPTTWNFLNYLTCPDLARLTKLGDDRFYDRAAFPPFVAKAVEVAHAFVGDLAAGYTLASGRLARLGQFWNLDTGLGLRIQSVPQVKVHRAGAHEPGQSVPLDRRAVVTRIDWVHVLGRAGIGQAVSYERADPPPYTAAMPEAAEPYPLARWKEGERAFKTYPAPEFRRLQAVKEDGAVVDQRRYLDRLSLQHPHAALKQGPLFDRLRDIKPDASDDARFEEALFADDGPAPPAASEQVPSGKALKALAPIVHPRLDLEIRASIARLGASPRHLAMFLLGDRADDVQDPVSEDKPPAAAAEPEKSQEAATKWLRLHSKILDRVVDPDDLPESDAAGLATFSTRILLNLSKEKLETRVVEPEGKWNNVVPWSAHKGQYGRNFAVATARQDTLRAEKAASRANNFDTKDFKVLRSFGLTEHCFFTVHPLVRIGGEWWDAFSKTKVESKEKLRDLKKVDAINFVKIVLLYDVGPFGAVQLDWCYVDGVRLRVEPAAE